MEILYHRTSFPSSVTSRWQLTGLYSAGICALHTSHLRQLAWRRIPSDRKCPLWDWAAGSRAVGPQEGCDGGGISGMGEGQTPCTAALAT